MLPSAATPSRSRSAPAVGRPRLGAVPVLTVVVVPPGLVPGGVPPQLALQAAPTTPSRAPALSQTPAGATSWPRLSPGLAPELALLPAARATPDRPPAAAAKPAASRAVFAVLVAHGRMGTP